MAQPVDAVIQDEWLRRQQREAQEQQRREQRPDFRFELPSPEVSPAAAAPAEDFCFQLDHIRLEGDMPSGFGWLQDELRAWQGRCLGQQGLAQLLKSLNGSLLARGYVTSRLAFPEQDLKSGTPVSAAVLIGPLCQKDRPHTRQLSSVWEPPVSALA